MNDSLQLVTPRILLRSWRDTDRAPFAALNADPAVMTYFNAPMSLAESNAAIDRYNMQLARDGFTMFAAECRQTGELIGVVGMQVMRDVVPNLPQPAVEIGWRLAASAHGKGFATEGATAVVQHAFHCVRLPQVVAITVPGNAASRKVMHKLGMTHRTELTFSHPRFADGHPCQEHILYSLDNSSYSSSTTSAGVPCSIHA